MKQTQQYGRTMRKISGTPSPRSARRSWDTADAVFVLGTLFVLLFLYRMTGGLSTDADRIMAGENVAVAVMSTGVAESGEEKEMLREVTGEPFGYMSGEWNLWEYIGDVMASLLTGG